MPTLPASTAQRLIALLANQLSPSDLDAARRILDRLDPTTHRTTVGEAIRVAFPDRTDDAANRALLRLRERIAEAAADAGVVITLEVSGGKSLGNDRALHFEGQAPLPKPDVTAELPETRRVLVPDVRATIVHDEPRLRLTERDAAGRPIVRWFFSYAHADMKDARALADTLDAKLRLSPKYAFERWMDGDLIVSEHFDARIREALETAHLGVLALSTAFLSSDYIRRVELPAFVKGAAGVQGRRVVPAALCPIDFAHTDLRGLEARQIYRDDETKAFTERTRHRREAWCVGLVGQIHKLCDRYGDPTPPEHNPDPNPDDPSPPCGPSRRLPHPRDAIKPDLADSAPLAENAARALRLGGLRAAAEGAEGAEERSGVNALDHLLAWVRDRTEPPLFAVLGEYGMGKTVTLQRFVRRVGELREAGESALPHPLYFDLRQLTGMRDRVPFTLDEILDACMNGWRREDAPALRAAEVRDIAKTTPVLFVVDGLDEALVHLTEADGVAFTRELLRLHPVRQETAAGSRLVLSCRTHYFKSLAAQTAHFTAQDRGGVEASDYRAMVLLPFGEAQIRTYLQAAVPGIDPDRLMGMLDAVHDLRDLAARPYTLKLVSEFVPELEQLQADGRRVYGVTVYRQVVQRWLHRDVGKHQLKPEHKERLMNHLAAWSWRRGQRTLPVDALEDWFITWLHEDPALRARYRDVHADKLEEDLRTATFLVRHDGDGGGFRFAHTSMQEFFLSGYLFEALQDDRPERWDLPDPSAETWDFFGQRLLEAGPAELVARLSRWASDGRGRAPLLLRYAMRATEAGLPVPILDGLDVRGIDLQGAAIGALRLRRSRWDGANLRETRWHHTDLSGASLVGVDLARSEWVDVEAAGADLRDTRCSGAAFRRFGWSGGTWDGGEGRYVQWLHTTPPAWAEGPEARGLFAGRGGEARRCEVVEVFPFHHGWVRSVAWSPDGSQALSGGHDGTVRLWDARSGICLATWNGHEGWVWSVAWSPDGSRALSGGDDGVRVWDAPTGTCLAAWTGHEDRVRSVAWSPDGSQALSGGDDGTVRLWDARTGTCLASWSGHKSWVASVAWSPDGSKVLSGGSDGTVRLCNAQTGACLATWAGHNHGVRSVAWSPDGSKALSGGSDGTVRLWDAQTGTCLATWKGHKGGVWSVAWSPDGSQVLSAGNDRTVRRWDARTGTRLATWHGHHDGVDSVGWSPDGSKALSAGNDGTVRCWDAHSGTCLATWTDRQSGVTSVAWSPDGSKVLSAGNDGTVRLWDARSGTCLIAWNGHDDAVNSVAWSPDGSKALSGGDDDTVRVWDARSGTCLVSCNDVHLSWVDSVAWSPDGSQVLSAADDGTVRLWDARSGTCVATWNGHEGGVTSVAWSPDGSKALSASEDNTVRLWDARVGACLATWNGHEDWVRSVAWSPDGSKALSAGDDGTVRLWDAHTGTCLATWKGHEDWVTSVAWSPDGSEALSGGDDGTIRRWDAQTGTCLATWTGHVGSVASVAWSPDGSQALSAGYDGTVRLWDAATGACLRVHAMHDGDHAVFDPRPRAQGGQILEATEGAWRWLRWAVGGDGLPFDILPAEAFGPLPAPRALTTAPRSGHRP